MAAPKNEPRSRRRSPDPANLSWQARAACNEAEVYPETFYPDKGMSAKAAKKVCRGCPVRRECLEYALAYDERFGIWGGLSERERRRVKRERRLAAETRAGQAQQAAAA